MPCTVYFAARPDSWASYEAPLRRALEAAGVEAVLSAEAPDPAIVDYLVCAPDGPVQDFSPFTRAKAVLNLWAGVENIAPNQTLTQPLARMVDPGLQAGMVEWVTGHVLRHHLGMDADIGNTSGDWAPRVPPLAHERRVAILGLGELGAACGAALNGLGFDVLGWSRTPKTLPGIACHSGEDGLKAVLKRAEILVLLLPLTAQTENLIDAAALETLPRGAVIINPGRGPLIDDDALLAALDSGQVSHATLDVFRVEPLPKDHAFWAHPGVTITPHIAAATRAETAAPVIAENIRRGEAGEPFLHLVDRSAGY